MRDLQMTAFQRQIEVAKKYDLPVNVHSRYAGHYCIDLLIQQGVKKALLHAYDGSKKSVKKGLAAGFYFSIPAAVKESTTFQRLAQTVPLEKMLLETDSPALGLEGKPNSVLNISLLWKEVVTIAVSNLRIRAPEIVWVWWTYYLYSNDFQLQVTFFAFSCFLNILMRKKCVFCELPKRYDRQRILYEVVGWCTSQSRTVLSMWLKTLDPVHTIIFSLLQKVTFVTAMLSPTPI